jgi:hypothetical protein
MGCPQRVIPVLGLLVNYGELPGTHLHGLPSQPTLTDAEQVLQQFVGLKRVAIPSAVYRLLSTQSLEEMRSFAKQPSHPRRKATRFECPRGALC